MNTDNESPSSSKNYMNNTSPINDNFGANEVYRYDTVYSTLTFIVIFGLLHMAKRLK